MKNTNKEEATRKEHDPQRKNKKQEQRKKKQEHEEEEEAEKWHRKVTRTNELLLFYKQKVGILALSPTLQGVPAKTLNAQSNDPN